jgi:urease accessory protein
MHRAMSVRRAGAVEQSLAVDRVVLDADGRQRRRLVLTGEKGTRFLLDLPRATVLRDGDGLVLDDGSIVEVASRPEPLVEIAPACPPDRVQPVHPVHCSHVAHLARLAWHLGNRHVEIQVLGDRLRTRRDHVVEAMLLGLGASLTPVEAPFEPERGAYTHLHDDDGEFHV